MAFKIIVVCICAVLVQSLSAQCVGNIGGLGAPNFGLAGNFLPSPPMSVGCGASNPVLPTSGGSFIVTSTSPIAPTGIQVIAEDLLIEGPLEVVGNLPLLGTVAVEGVLPSNGQASTVYGCGDGNVGILSDFAPATAGIGATQREATQFNTAAQIGAAEFAAAQREATQLNAAAQFGAAQLGAAEFAAAQREAQFAAQREAAQFNAAAQFGAAQLGAADFAAAQREAQFAAAQREAQFATQREAAQLSAASLGAADFNAAQMGAPCYM